VLVKVEVLSLEICVSFIEQEMDGVMSLKDFVGLGGDKGGCGSYEQQQRLVQFAARGGIGIMTALVDVSLPGRRGGVNPVVEYPRIGKLKSGKRKTWEERFGVATYAELRA